MTSIASTQALLSNLALQDASVAKDEGRGDLKEVKKERTELRAEIAQRKEKAAELEEDLVEAQDSMSGFGGFVKGLFGGDGGAGKVGDQMGENAAELERAQNQIKVMKAETNDLLQDINSEQEKVTETYQAIEEMLREDGKTSQHSRLA